GTSPRHREVIVRHDPAWTKKRRRSASISSLAVWKKQRTIKCSKRAGRNSNRKVELFELGFACCGQSAGQANSLGCDPVARRTLARAFSPNQRFHHYVVRES